MDKSKPQMGLKVDLKKRPEPTTEAKVCLCLNRECRFITVQRKNIAHANWWKLPWEKAPFHGAPANSLTHSSPTDQKGQQASDE